MAQITWQNVAAPDLSGQLEAYARMGQNLSGAFDKLGGIFTQRNTDAKAKYSDELLGKVMLAQDPAALDAMRANIMGDHSWQLEGQKAAIGEALTKQTGVLQDQSIKREGIIDDQAVRDSGPAYLADLATGYKTGHPVFDGISARIATKLAPGLLTGSNQGRDANLADSKFTFDKAQTAIDNSFKTQELGLSRQRQADSHSEHLANIKDAATEKGAFALGGQFAENAQLNGAHTEAEQARMTSDFIVKHGLNANAAKNFMLGVSARYPEITSTNAVRGFKDPVANDLLDHAHRLTAQKVQSLSAKLDDPSRKTGVQSLIEANSKPVNTLTALKGYRFNKDPGDLAEMNNFFEKYSDINPGLLVDIANRTADPNNFSNVYAGHIDDKIMAGYVANIRNATDPKNPIADVPVYNAQSNKFKAQITQAKAEEQKLISRMSADLRTYGKLQPATIQFAHDKGLNTAISDYAKETPSNPSGSTPDDNRQ